MKVTVNIPNELCDDFIKTALSRANINENPVNIQYPEEYTINRYDKEDIKLYKWLAAIVVNELLDQELSKKYN